MAQPEFIAVQKALSGISYPARKDQLIQHAKDHGADKETLDALNGLPDQEYGGPNEVSAAVAHE
jgi:Protein of unknown function (DUF2795)